MDVIFGPKRGRPFSIKVGFFDTVLEIKHKIQKYQGIPSAAQTLVFNVQVLQDERDVGSCKILHKSRILLIFDIPDQYRDQKLPPQPLHVPVKFEQPSPPQVLPCMSKIQMNVRIPSMGFYFPMEMDAGDSFLRLKERIHEAERMTVNIIVLLLGKAYLDDHKMIGECDLTDNAEVGFRIRQSFPASMEQAQGAAWTTAATETPSRSSTAALPEDREAVSLFCMRLAFDFVSGGSGAFHA